MTESIYKIISRAEAKKLGLKRYFTGKPCKHGHISEYRTANYKCVACENSGERKDYREQYRQDLIEKNPEYYKQRYQDTKEECLEYQRQYYQGHKEERSEYNKQYYQDLIERYPEYYKQYYHDNKEERSEYAKRWREANPEKVVESLRFRNTKKENAIPKWFEEDLVKQIYVKCNELNKRWGTKLQVDHIIPIVNDNVCGLHCWHNLQLLDQPLNGSKSNRFKTDW
jgi:hypothetical protein